MEEGQSPSTSRPVWQSVMLSAGGISAAMSEESMSRLKFCLQWLQYATQHIDAQILLLRSFISSLSPHQNPLPDLENPGSPQEAGPSSSEDALVPIQTLQTLSEVKKDLVSTIRQVVDVVSKYAGSALPEPARNTVRTFILKLPERWASAARADSASGIASLPSTPGVEYRAGQRPTAGTATVAAARVLTLATESLDMMRGVTSVVNDSLDRAET